MSDVLVPGYAELHAISNFSFLRGASHPEEMVRQAHTLGYAGLALTDECSMAGIVRAHTAARDCGLKLLVGCEDSLREWIGKRPEITLEELGEKLLVEKKVRASASSIWCKLQRLGLRHKKNGFRGRAGPG